MGETEEGGRADAMPGRRSTPRPDVRVGGRHPAPGHGAPRLGGHRVGSGDRPGLRLVLGAARAGVRARAGRGVPAQRDQQDRLRRRRHVLRARGRAGARGPAARRGPGGPGRRPGPVPPRHLAPRLQPVADAAAGAGVLRPAAEQGHGVAVRASPGDASSRCSTATRAGRAAGRRPATSASAPPGSTSCRASDAVWGFASEAPTHLVGLLADTEHLTVTTGRVYAGHVEDPRKVEDESLLVVTTGRAVGRRAGAGRRPLRHRLPPARGRDVRAGALHVRVLSRSGQPSTYLMGSGRPVGPAGLPSRAAPASSPAPTRPACAPAMAGSTGGGSGRWSRPGSSSATSSGGRVPDVPRPPPSTMTSGSSRCTTWARAWATARAAESTISAAPGRRRPPRARSRCVRRASSPVCRR